MNETKNWNAVYTRTSYEKNVSHLLEKKGIVHFCPLNQITGADPKKNTVSPLFPSVIFVQAPGNMDLLSLAQLPNVTNLLYWHQQPAAFPDAEIGLLRNFLEAHETVQVTKTALSSASISSAVETAGSSYTPADKMYTLTLPSIGYSLSAKAVSVTNVKLVGRNAARFKAANSLAFILGFKSARQQA